MITPEARERLAEHMDHRRLELRLTWREVADAGGISYEAVRNVRSTRAGGIAPLTKRAIETGLEWAEGSVDLILAGGEPAPLPASDSRFAGLSSDASDPRKWVPSVPGDLAPWFSEAFTEVTGEYDRAADRYPDPSGAQIFSSIDEARAWDDMGSIMAGNAPLSAEQKIVWMAWNRAAYRRAAGEEPGGNRARAAGLIPDPVPV